MRDRLAELDPTPTLALVTFADQSGLREYVTTHRLDMAVVRDPERAGYATFGFGRGTWRRVWGPRAALAYLRSWPRRAGRRLHRPTDDTRQLGGDVVIDAQGRLAWIHHGAGPDDRPHPDTIVAAVRAAR